HRWQEAQIAFLEALARDAQNYSALTGLAQSLLGQGRHIESRTYWRRAIQLDDTRPDGWAGLGRAYLAALNYAAARRNFSRALAAAPGPQSRWYLAALTLPTDLTAGRAALTAMTGETGLRDYLLAAVKPFTPRSPPAEVAAAAGIALVQLPDWETAHYALTVAAGLEPDNAQTWAFLGRTQAALGLPAMESFNRARELDPTLPLTPYFEGIYLRKRGLLKPALDRFLETLDLDPNNLAAALEAAFTLAEQGDYQSAEAWYRSVVTMEPEATEYRQLLVEFYVNRSFRVAKRGLPEAERLVELAPGSPRAFDLLGWARFQTGDFSGAEEALRQAITLDPADVSARYHLGRALKAQRRDVEAQAEFTRVIDWDTGGFYRDRVLKGTSNP
ncbi:MAG: tetratricopeptide repeat protein, partial [Anaerolineae bacterium]